MKAGSSIGVTPGSGATMATHLAGGKEHSSLILAAHDGHLRGKRHYYLALKPYAVCVSNEVGSGKRVLVHEITFHSLGQTSTDTSLLAEMVNVYRSDLPGTVQAIQGDAVGAVYTDTTNIWNNVNVAKIDPASPNLPSTVIVGTSLAGNRQSLAWRDRYSNTTNAANYWSTKSDPTFANAWIGDYIEVPEGYGIGLEGGGVIIARMVFSIEDV